MATIFNSRDTFHKDPFGAVAAGTPVTLRLVLPDSYRAPALQLFVNEAFDTPVQVQPLTAGGAAPDGGTIWSTVMTPDTPGLLFYNFVLDGGVVLGLEPDGSGAIGDPDLWQLTVYDPAFETPTALWGAVFYQIFPDRFATSGRKKDWVPTDRVLHTDWNEEPTARPDADGVFRCNDYFGGDLQGIIQKLPYLASLGVEGLYLNPIFEAHSNHRYNTADYLKVDPLLGVEADFTALCEAAHSHGIRVILDGVFNHTGSDSVYFNKNRRYGPHTGAYNDLDSPYHDWYAWIDFPKTYHSWWGFETLPDIREDSPSYREFICGEDGVLRRWLRAGADGFRLDVADELPDGFIAEIRTAIKSENPDALLMGEVWEDASNKMAYGERRQYFWGQELDSVMNYPWRSAIIGFVRYGYGQALLDAISIIMENYPPQVMAVTLNSLSTHDVPRALTAIAAESMDGKDREWQRQHNALSPDAYYAGRQMLLLAAILQFTLPGCPCIYYGDEAGLVGYADPFNRGTYPWGNEDAGLVDFFRLLGGLRKGLPVLRLGGFAPVSFEQSAVTYLREYQGETILISINRNSQGYRIPWDAAELAAGEVLLTAGGILGHDMLYGQSGAIIRLTAAKRQEVTK